MDWLVYLNLILPRYEVEEFGALFIEKHQLTAQQYEGPWFLKRHTPCDAHFISMGVRAKIC